MLAPFEVLMGSLFNPSIVEGEPFKLTVYSVSPIFAVPPGRIKFCALMALITSEGVSPLDCRALVSKSTEMTRCLPP